MYCQDCGTQLPDNARFCDSCGVLITTTYEKASTPISKDLVDRIYEDVLDLMIKSLENGNIDVDGSKALAKSITTNLDKAITHGDADKALAKLTKQYPCYQELYDQYHRVLIGID
jgi:predicted amidophosphoribosyltransferase